MTLSVNLEPLSGIYTEMGLVLPSIRLLEPEFIPEPYRRLLVHKDDMTPTLESAYSGRIHWRVIRYSVTTEFMKRMVVLELDGAHKPVEMGAIKIHLDRLPDAARETVLALREPFGGILRDEGILHTSQPTAYFEIAPDTLIAGALGANSAAGLYGRRNTIRDFEGRVLAEVVEILPPAPQEASL